MAGVEELIGSEQLQVIAQAVAAFLAGALIGLEREKARSSSSLEEREVSPPGVRSFGFVSLIGAMSAITSSRLESEVASSSSSSLLIMLVSASIALLPVLIIAFYTFYKLAIMREGGITTSLALALAYAVGIIVGMGLIVEGTAISVFATFMLATKLRIERIVKVMTYEELLSALQLGIIVFLVGPIFARDVYDPFIGVINFKSLYIFFVIILSLSYLGYVLVKTIGPKALSLFSLFGGLVHSEATVISVVRLGRRLNLPSSVISSGIVAASTSMVARNLLLVIALTLVNYPSATSVHMGHIMVGFVPPVIIGYFFMRLSEAAAEDREGVFKGEIVKPISYGIAVKALAVFVIILLVTTYVTLVVGSYGTLASAVLGGLVSAEAVIFTVFTLLNAGKTTINVAIASSLVSTSVAVLNKLLFARTAGADSSTLKRSLIALVLMSCAPLIAAYLMFTFQF